MTRVGERRGMRTRRLAALLAGLGCCLLLGLVPAGPAAAHATLVSTDPAEGARLEQAPDRVTLRFSEPVSLGAGYARLLDAGGTLRESTASVDDGTLTVVPGGVLPADRGYLVTYRVVSADSHPIAGAFSFVVGDGALVAADDAESSAGGDRLVGVLVLAARWIGYAGLAAAIGVPVLTLLCWPAGWASPRLRRMATAGALLAAAAAFAGFLLQGPYAAGTGLGSLLDPALLQATLESTTGWVLLVRAVLASSLAAVLQPAWHAGKPPEAPQLAGAAMFAVALVAANALDGHPVAGPWPGLAVPVDAVHVAAVSVWLGGSVGLLVAVLRRPADAGDLATALPRWSRLAFGAVAALVISGTVQAVRELGGPTALVVTTYGQLLVAKLVLVAVLLAAAGVSRVWVHQRLGVRPTRRGGRRTVVAHAFAAPSAGGPAPAEEASTVRSDPRPEDAARHLPSLRRSVLVETVVAAVVLALSAVLVGTPPARSAVSRPVDVLLPLEGSAGSSGSVQLSVDPARPGANTLHVYLFDDDGRLTQPAAIEVALTETARDVGPLDVDLEPAGPGHYVADGMAISGAGTWTLVVRVRLDEFTATTARTTFPVR